MTSGQLLGGLGVLAGALWLFFSGEEAKASPGGGGGQSGGGGGGGLSKAEDLQALLDYAVKSGDPAVMRKVADEIRATEWDGQELSYTAYNKAADLDAAAKSIEDYDAQNQPYHKPENWQENWEE